MSGAVHSALKNDPFLIQQDVAEHVYTDYSMETAPRDGLFIILRWGSQNVTPGIKTGPETLTVWVHQPREHGSDYTVVRQILRRVQQVLEGLEHVAGADNLSVTSIDYQGDSGNLFDPGFQTITRNSTYRVLLHLVA